ncbi:ABC transporter permease [Kordiimonas sp. SCSIO 12610]|uniref:ABC transporter permease n=1 Tax=Kordiimonas sp. SCSIO 12610 TaxID=2829597 RepID=UPI00210CCB43|nr:FtsX-like permease family protein [Kordiimonas sp. SCSIO 12610]UTW55767.1 ABC transporter permease [Kordiimonas sp. SCSIO 12610]
MGDVYLIFKNITRKKLRLILTLFATFIAFMIYGVMTSFQSALDAGVELSADDRLVVVNKINFTQSLPISYVNRIQNIDGIVGISHQNWFGGYYQEPQNAMPIFAVQQETFFDVYDELVMPEEQKEAWLKNRQGLLVGEKAAQNFGWKVGDRIPISSNIFSKKSGGSTWDFDVVAIYSAVDPQIDTSGVYFHFKYFDEARTFGQNTIGLIGVRTADPSLNEQVIAAIDDQFANSPFETETVPEKAFTKAFIEQIGNIGLIITFVVLAAFFIILVIVGNSMALAIRERTNEIAVMKTLGFQSGRIFRMVLGESLITALIGGGLGLFMATVLITAVSEALPQFPTLIIDGPIILEAIAIMLGLGLVTGIIPAVSALRLNIVTALSR